MTQLAPCNELTCGGRAAFYANIEGQQWWSVCWRKKYMFEGQHTHMNGLTWDERGSKLVYQVNISPTLNEKVDVK